VNQQLAEEEYRRQVEVERAAEQQQARELEDAEAATAAKETEAVTFVQDQSPQGDAAVADESGVEGPTDPNQSASATQLGAEDLNASGLNRSSSSAMNQNMSTGSAAGAKRSNLNSAAKTVTVASPKPPSGQGADAAKKKGKDGSRNQTPAAGKADPNVGTGDEGGAEEGGVGGGHLEAPQPQQSIYMITAQFLLDINALKLADRALSHELTSVTRGGGGASLLYHLSLARLNLLQGNLVQAEKSARQAISLDFKSGEAWSLDGHVHFLRGEKEEARVSYERVLSFSPPSPHMHSIYLRLASIYLAEGQFEDAKCTYLLACRDSPSCTAWHGVGVACYRLGALPEAEDALCEANVLNNRDPEVWAYLTLVCLQTGRPFEAEQSYKYALKVGLENDDLLREIHDLQKAVGFGDPSF